MNRMIGITGGMAAGKSTLARKIHEYYPDFIYIDVDCFRRNLFQDQRYLEKLREVIPELCREKTINSNSLNRYIYQDILYMKEYKKILYSYLFNYCDQFQEKTILIDWALIIPDQLLNYFDQIIYLWTREEVRLRRLQNSDLSKEEILKRFRLQEVENISQYQSEAFLIVNGEEICMKEIKQWIDSMECKFTLPKEGGKAIWEITHQCNYQCSYCIFSSNCQKVPGELTTEECFSVIDELEKNGFRHLKITGGEPFLRSDMIPILKYASSRLYTDISTNASLITEKMVEELNEISLKMIHVSLDGNCYEHESVRGKNTYERTKRGLEYLKKSKNKIRIGCVIHANNERTLENLIQDCILVGALEVIFSIMEPMDGQDRSLMKTKPNEELALEIGQLQKKYCASISVQYNFLQPVNYVHKCPGGKTFLYINHLGRISPCPWIYETHKELLSEGTLKNMSLEELLKEEKMKHFIKNRDKGICYGKI